MIEKLTVEIGSSAKATVWRDGEWTILYVEDGGGGKTTISLSVGNAIDLAALIRGSAITASTQLKDYHRPRELSPLTRDQT